jgi:hypothetical protein
MEPDNASKSFKKKDLAFVILIILIPILLALWCGPTAPEYGPGNPEGAVSAPSPLAPKNQKPKI